MVTTNKINSHRDVRADGIGHSCSKAPLFRLSNHAKKTQLKYEVSSMYFILKPSSQLMQSLCILRGQCENVPDIGSEIFSTLEAPKYSAPME